MWLALVVVWCSAAHPPVEKRAPRDQQERCGWKQNRETGGGARSWLGVGFIKGVGGVFVDREHRSYPSRCAYTSFVYAAQNPGALHALQQSTTMLRLLVLLLPAAIIMSIIQASVGFLVTCSPADGLLPVGAESTSASCVCIPPFVKCCFTAVHVFLRRVCVHALLSSHHACLYFRFSRELDVCMHALRAPSAVLFGLHINGVYITQSATVGKVPTTLPYQCTTARGTQRAARASHTAG